MAWTKGRARGKKTPGSGRPKGAKNKVTVELKTMILNALDAAGGQDYLQRQANDNPTAFLTLIGKVLPSEIKGMGDNGAIVIEMVKFANTDTR